MRRVLLAVLAALIPMGLLVAAAPAGSAGTAGAVGGAGAISLTPATSAAPLAAARPDTVCQGDGTGCTKAGSYPNLNAAINSDYNGFHVVWTSSVVQPYSSGVPLYWTANVTYTNVTSQTLDLGCPGSWTSPSYVWEWMSGGSGDDGGVAASSTTCSVDPGITAAIPPGGTLTSTATFHNVPWPGSAVAIQWGDAGTSAAVQAFAPTSPVPPCTINPLFQCQSLNPRVALDIDYWGDASACVFTWNVNWGDGTASDDLIVTGPPDGEELLVSHSYQAQGTYPISVTGSESTGDCTLVPFTATFTLLVYAALGDSYSAGVGAGNYVFPLAAAPCWLSNNAYPELVDSELGNDPQHRPSQFAFVACNGAEISAFENSQEPGVLPQLADLEFFGGPVVGLLTFTISGNDAQFAQVMTYCAQRTAKEKSCQATYGVEVAADLASIKKKLPVLFSYIRGLNVLAPGAKVLVVGYPQFFDPAWLPPKAKTPTCGTGVSIKIGDKTYGDTFLKSDMNWIDTSIRALDKELQGSAAAAGFGYVDDSTAFAGHYLCEPASYLNSVVLIPPSHSFMSYHPTAAGQRVIADLVEKALDIG